MRILGIATMLVCLSALPATGLWVAGAVDNPVGIGLLFLYAHILLFARRNGDGNPERNTQA